MVKVFLPGNLLKVEPSHSYQAKPWTLSLFLLFSLNICGGHLHARLEVCEVLNIHTTLVMLNSHNSDYKAHKAKNIY